MKYLYKAIAQSTSVWSNISSWVAYIIFILPVGLCTRAKGLQHHRRVRRYGQWEVICVFHKFVFQLVSAVWRRVKICPVPYTFRDVSHLWLPKTFAKYMQRGSLDHQQRTGWIKKLLSVYIAKQFGGQHQQPAFFQTTQEVCRRQHLTFKVSMRRTLRLSPTELSLAW